ncbi:MAG: PTS sugar transporter subunit IIA [bacterium]
MVGVLLISHGKLCEQLLESNAMIAGPMEQAGSVALRAGENPDLYGERIRKAILELNTGMGVLVLVDMLGGTPYNQIGSLARDLPVQIVTGMNMPMLMSLALNREEDSTLTQLADMAFESAQQGVKLLRKKETQLGKGS